MRRILLTLSLCATVLLFSCQKEVKFSNDNNNGSGSSNNSSGTLLVKAESKTGSETSTYIYTYNAAKKLINEKLVGKSGGMDLGNELRIYRNTDGVITKYTQINAMLALAGVDSIPTRVHYNTTSSRYTSTVSEMSLLGFVSLDSTVFIYDGSGKIIEEDTYQEFAGSGYMLTTKNKFKYDAAGDNLVQLDTYITDPVTSSEDLLATNKFTVNTQKSPLVLGIEAIVLMHHDLYNKNNLVGFEIIDVENPANGLTVASTYTLNSNQLPASSVATRNPGNITISSKYFYQ